MEKPVEQARATPFHLIPLVPFLRRKLITFASPPFQPTLDPLPDPACGHEGAGMDLPRFLEKDIDGVQERGLQRRSESG